VGQGRTVFATQPNGFVSAGRGQGLFVNETRLLSRYEYRIDDRAPHPAALSSVEQHTWLGYYILLPPGFDPGPPDQGSGQVAAYSQNSLELRLSRYVAGGVHEDVDLTNFTQRPSSFCLQLELDADFAGIDETIGPREQHGRKSRTWRPADGVLAFSYVARHRYEHQGERGTAIFRCGMEVRVARADSLPRFKNNVLQFQIDLQPSASWHACIYLIPIIDGKRLLAEHVVCSFEEASDPSDAARQAFVKDSTSFITPGDGALSHVVARSLDQACKDLSALRLHDLDQNEHAWTVAAGLPIYLALFGRDTLTAAWQAALLSTDLLRGTLPEIARWQGTEVNDWRDEQPGRMLHEAHTDPLSILNYTPRQRYYGAVSTSPFFSVALSLLWHWTGDKSLISPIGSDPGHCVATGIVDNSLVRRVADRLLSEDLYSGWGIRTLSADHPAYNPYSYHRGSVWPVENATFALGFTRYGLLSHMERLCRAQFEAAGLFDYCRLPELFSGHRRDSQHPFPAFYPDANWPQAWSASSIFLLLEAMLGLYPYAPLKLLFLDPQLPPWLPEITLDNLRVGEAVVKVRFYRKADGASDYQIQDQRGHLHVFRQPSPWSLRLSFAERIRDILSSFLPGK
jgi:glycogen debranching enzyme